MCPTVIVGTPLEVRLEMFQAISRKLLQTRIRKIVSAILLDCLQFNCREMLLRETGLQGDLPAQDQPDQAWHSLGQAPCPPAISQTVRMGAARGGAGGIHCPHLHCVNVCSKQ